MLEEIDRRIRTRTSFAFETTLSGVTYANRISRWQELGYWVELVFLKLDSVELALARVAARVSQGGHAIPEETVRRRFVSGWTNFETLYRPRVDEWVLYDNSDVTPVELASGVKS